MLLAYLLGIVVHPIKTLDRLRPAEKVYLNGMLTTAVAGAFAGISFLLPVVHESSANSFVPLVNWNILWGVPLLMVISAIVFGFLGVLSIIAGAWTHLFCLLFRAKGKAHTTINYVSLSLTLVPVALALYNLIERGLVPFIVPNGAKLSNVVSLILLIACSLWPLTILVLAIQRAHSLPIARAVLIVLTSLVAASPLVLFMSSL